MEYAGICHRKPARPGSVNAVVRAISPDLRAGRLGKKPQMKHHRLIYIALVLCFSLFAGKLCAQGWPGIHPITPGTPQQATGANQPGKLDLFIGYSYLGFDTAGLDPRLSFNGMEATASYRFLPWLAGEADLSFHYGPNCALVLGVNCKEGSVMGGPRFQIKRGRITPYIHGLAGIDHANIIAVTDTPFSYAAGGGLDCAITKHFTWRTWQLDYMMTEHGRSVGVPHQNNFRVASGIVFTL